MIQLANASVLFNKFLAYSLTLRFHTFFHKKKNVSVISLICHTALTMTNKG